MKKALYLLLALSALTQCRPDVIEEFVPLGSQESAILGLLQQAADPNAETTLTLSFPDADTIRMSTSRGSEVEIRNPQTDLVNEQGVTVPCKSCNELKITLKEVTTNRQLVAHGLNMHSSALKVARTTGALFLEIYCDGKLLQPAPDAELFVELVNLDPLVNQVQHFTAVLDQNKRIVNWENTPDHFIYNFTRSNTIYQGYEFQIKKFGWNVGLIPLQASTGAFCLNMDPKYNSENAFAYLILGSERAAVRMPFDTNRGQFCLEGVPLDLNAKVFVISKLADSWQTDQADVNTSVGQFTLNPAKATEQEIIQKVKDL